MTAINNAASTLRSSAGLAAVLFAIASACGQQPPAHSTQATMSEPADSLPHAAAPASHFDLNPAPLDKPLVTDRPDFTESTSVVPRGRLQLEGGYTFTYDRENGRRIKDHTFPEFLLRTGLVDDVELRIGWAGFSLTESLFREQNDAGRHVWTTAHDDAGTDMDVGFKLHLIEQNGLVPEFGVIGSLSLPTGASGKTSGDIDPQVKWLWSYDLTDRLSLSGNVNLAVPTSADARFFQTAASASLAYTWTDWLGSFAEYYGFYPNDRGRDSAHYLDGGFSFRITDNVQFDVRAGFGLNREADDFFSGVGFAFRF